ncbi:MAG: helix-turn-helix domain-containing protein [Candidatus Omnitrophica bacterium]|nr:helix-turn-helix domain-containing protein [Candidatus Omnitrophota bacterium]
MGVVYKLTEDVVSFIIERKQGTPRLSCREIADLVRERHQRTISKSSVHDVLKEHGVAIPRGRKPKIKFQIPPEKKQQLFANVVPGVVFQPVTPAPITALLSPPNVLVGGPESANALDSRQKHSGMTNRGEIQERMGEIFIKAAFWDLSPRPLWGIKKLEDIKSLNLNNLQEEWGYISTLVERLKIDLEDGSCVEMDSRFQTLGSGDPGMAVFPASIERCTQEVVDRIINNINPLCIRSVSDGLSDGAILNFFQSCEGIPGKGMTQASLLGAGGSVLAQFACPAYSSPCQKKKAILGMPRNLKVEQNDHKLRYFELKVDGYDKNMSVLSNISPHISNDEIVRIFKDRHPPVQINTSPLADGLRGDIADQPAWVLVRLKARARVFFPSDLGQDAFESVLALKGRSFDTAQGKHITLLTPVSYAYSAFLRQAADNVNALNIRDENGRRVLCQIASENDANF